MSPKDPTRGMIALYGSGAKPLPAAPSAPPRPIECMLWMTVDSGLTIDVDVEATDAGKPYVAMYPDRQRGALTADEAHEIADALLHAARKTRELEGHSEPGRAYRCGSPCQVCLDRERNYVEPPEFDYDSTEPVRSPVVAAMTGRPWIEDKTPWALR